MVCPIAVVFSNWMIMLDSAEESDRLVGKVVGFLIVSVYHFVLQAKRQTIGHWTRMER